MSNRQWAIAVVVLALIIASVVIYVVQTDKRQYNSYNGATVPCAPTPQYTISCNGQYDCYRLDTRTGDIKEVR